MKSASGYVLVEVESRFDETIKTDSGITLYKYLQKGNETKDVNYWGIVAAVPDDAKWDIVPEVKVGDKVYFHYNSLLNDQNSELVFQDKLIITEGGNYWRIPYYDVFCAVRGEDIIPIGGWCLISPETKKMDLGFLSNPDLPEVIIKSEISGILRYIGTPKKGAEPMNPQPKPGDVVGFEKYDSFENEIEGQVYYCMPQERILGIYEREVRQ